MTDGNGGCHPKTDVDDTMGVEVDVELVILDE